MRRNRTIRVLQLTLLGGWMVMGATMVQAQTINVKPSPIVPPTIPPLPDAPTPLPPAAQVPSSAPPPPSLIMPDVPSKDIAGKKIESLIIDAIENHDRVLGARTDVETAKRKARVSLGAWFPKLDSTVDYGWEHQKRHELSTTSMPFEEYDLHFSQLLWDFGKTNAAIRKSAVEVTKAETALRRVSNDVMLEAIKAYAGLLKTYEVVGFATRSRDNIRKQTGLEETRVETGGGLTTDVLQAKSELAGAEARLGQAEGAMITARNRFANVFQFAPADISAMAPLRVPNELLSPTLDDALKMALDNNFRLRAARLDEDIAKEEIKRVRADEFTPRIEAVIERKWQYDVAATYGDKGISIGKLEMKMPLNLGLTGLDSIAAAKSDYTSKTKASADLQRIVTEEVRNAWSNLRTAQRTVQTLQNQADISAAFLDLARHEQQLGQRTLLDVLSGETRQINALSDASSAKVDALIAAFDLLNATGQLSGEALQSAEAPADAPSSPASGLPAVPAPAPEPN